MPCRALLKGFRGLSAHCIRSKVELCSTLWCGWCATNSLLHGTESLTFSAARRLLGSVIRPAFHDLQFTILLLPLVSSSTSLHYNNTNYITTTR